MVRACVIALVVLSGVEGITVRPEPSPKVGSVAIFLQMANVELWPELRTCIQHVASAGNLRRGFSTSLHVALIQADQQSMTSVKEFQAQAGLVDVNVSIVENKGADWGEFLQQILMHEPIAKYDLLLKLHSKTQTDWRRKIFDSLCGSPEQVEGIFSLFDKNQTVGMIGPDRLTWTWDTKNEESFNGYADWGFRNDNMEDHVRTTWNKIYGLETPRRENLRMSAGSMFWSRYAPLVLDEELRRSVPLLMRGFPTHHKSREGCKDEACYAMYALERVIPTSIKHKYGLDVIPALNVSSESKR